MIPNTFSVSFSMSIVPLFTAHYAKNEIRKMNNQFSTIIVTYLLITLPLCIFIAVSAYPLYYLFYGESSEGSEILSVYIMISILISFFSIAAAILQGINKQFYTIIALLIGLISKIIFQVPLMLWFKEFGAILATGIGYLFSTLYILFVLKTRMNASFNSGKKPLLLILCINLIFLWIVHLSYQLLLNWIPIHTKINALSVLVILSILSFGFYFFCVIGLKSLKRYFKEAS